MMGFDEDLHRLAPIIGHAKARRLWRAYQVEDRDGKQDIHSWVRLKMDKELKDSNAAPGSAFLSSPPSSYAGGKYKLGAIKRSKNREIMFGLREEEMIRHIGIFGMSGAGKTNTVALLVQQLHKAGKPFMLFDWKQNYRDLPKADTAVPLEIYTVGRKIRPLSFNPLLPPHGTHPKVWLKKLIEVMCNAYYLGEGVTFLLMEAIDAVYHRFGFYDEDCCVGRLPTMRDVLAELKKLNLKGRKALWLDSALRAMQTLCFGPISEVVNNEEMSSQIMPLLGQQAVLELDALAHAEKIFFIESLLIWIHHFRMTERKREVFKHAIIIEEAHNILGVSEKDVVINTLLREIREFGECIVLVDQHPSMMSIPALGNTYCTIGLNMKHNRDIQALGDAMQVNVYDRELFGRLSTGQAVVKLQDRFTQPFMITIPKVNIPKGSVTDQWIHNHSNTDSADSGKTEEKKAPKAPNEGLTGNRKNSGKIAESPLSELEKQLMKDILHDPLDGVVRRYSRLKVSRRRGNGAVLKLLSLGALEKISIPTESGKVVILTPTAEMKKSLIRNGVTKPDNFKEGGILHRYWKQRISDELIKRGWKTTIEKPIGNNRQVDVHAEQDSRKMAVEVETGAGSPSNVEKALDHGYDKVLVVFVGEQIIPGWIADMNGKLAESGRIVWAKVSDICSIMDELAKIS